MSSRTAHAPGVVRAFQRSSRVRGSCPARSYLLPPRTWPREPFDAADTLLNDVGTALDGLPPAEEYLEELAERLREHLMQLVDIAIVAVPTSKTPPLTLVDHARDTGSKTMPGEPSVTSAAGLDREGSLQARGTPIRGEGQPGDFGTIPARAGELPC
ncbi:DUF6415 family natural product biosynthesis protein [Streptomyces sp. NPDC006516]|uniref:DUF6415 family natural product biosynthesis protein n=1 Tax=Streptomyces sp. NPDC006516 TaxID=3154309 RepID=UPI0033B80CEC